MSFSRSGSLATNGTGFAFVIDDVSDPERWLPVEGYSYEVSSRGRVRRTGRDPSDARFGRIHKPRNDKNGYPYVILCRDGVTKTFKVHRLVCQAFWGAPPSYIEGKAEVRHMNARRDDPSHWDLQWGSSQDNADDREGHGHQVKGEAAPRSIFTQAQVDEIRARHAEALEQRRKEGFVRVRRTWISELSLELGCKVYTLAAILYGHGYGMTARRSA